MKYDKGYVLSLLAPSALWTIHGDKIVEWNSSDIQQPSEEEIQNKIAELEADRPMRLLKEERNQRIAESDWRFLSDQTPSQAWIDYRQALRDLPANSSPELDENGQWTNITWPEKPE